VNQKKKKQSGRFTITTKRPWPNLGLGLEVYNLTVGMGLELAAVDHGHGLGGLARLATERLNLLDDVHTLGHLAENDVLVVQPRGFHRANKELGAVSVGAGIGHRQNSWSGVLEGEVLVGKLLAVDGLAAGAVVVGEVTALAHEVGDHAVEAAALETEPLLARAQGAKVLRRLRNNVGTQLHDDAAGGLTVDGHIEEDLGKRHLGVRACGVANR